jgi:hypothetical protein
LQQGVDVAVFILWTRLGTPLGALIRKSDGSPYRSGTEREYDLMLQARALTRETEGVARPSLLVYTHRDDASFAETLRNARSSQELAAQQPADDAHALLTEFEIAPPRSRDFFLVPHYCKLAEQRSLTRLLQGNVEELPAILQPQIDRARLLLNKTETTSQQR